MIHTEPEVIILADSVSPITGKRITTFQLKYWRAIHAEVLRHRCFSHSVRSSRACPTSKYIEEVAKEPWGPAHWGSNQKGMTAGKDIDNPLIAQATWENAAKSVAMIASCFNLYNVHKQITNRLLEPFTYVYDVMTGTEWENFFDLRCAPDAQPEIQDLANKMKKAMNEHEPVRLEHGQWHLPYITADLYDAYDTKTLKYISAARCARVSYKCFDGSSSVEKDLELANKLIKSKHWSPFEHQATPDDGEDRFKWKKYWGNFQDWIQLRQILEKGEISM